MIIILSDGTALESTSIMLVKPIREEGNGYITELGFLIVGIGYKYHHSVFYDEECLKEHKIKTEQIEKDRLFVINSIRPLKLV